MTHRWDTVYYVASQFRGAIVGVFVARQLLGQGLSAPPVRYVEFPLDLWKQCELLEARRKGTS